MSIESSFEEIRDEAGNENKLIDLYEINEDSAIDPLSKVVPTETIFFGSYVCNILVFTNLYMNGSNEFDSEVETSKAFLAEVFGQFAKYETHVWIDSSSGDILDADSDDLDTFEDLLVAMCDELAVYGFTYHGRLGSGLLADSIRAVIADFSTGL